jgi:serine/threonine protein phosphatase 1
MARLDELREAAGGLTDADVAFLDSAVPVAHLPEHGAVVVHAGILPTHAALPADTAGMSGRERKHLELVYRVRYVNPDGKMVVLGDETDADRYWADLYDGRFGHAYFGHQPFHDRSGPVEFPHATGLDLGAVYGNRLAAAVLTGTAPARFVTVPAHARFAEPHSDTE